MHIFFLCLYLSLSSSLCVSSVLTAVSNISQSIAAVCRVSSSGKTVALHCTVLTELQSSTLWKRTLTWQCEIVWCEHGAQLCTRYYARHWWNVTLYSRLDGLSHIMQWWIFHPSVNSIAEEGVWSRHRVLATNSSIHYREGTFRQWFENRKQLCFTRLRLEKQQEAWKICQEIGKQFACDRNRPFKARLALAFPAFSCCIA